MKKMKKIIFFTLLSVTFSAPLWAEQAPRGLSADSRIKVVAYDPNNVTRISAHFGYQTMIVFSDEETVQNVSVGDSLAWQIVPASNHLFVKPMASSTTNMTVLTNVRSYNFQLETSNKNAGNTYQVTFIYPSENKTNYQQISPYQCNLPNVNIRYSYTGDASQAPLAVCDDGKFTYFKFKKSGYTSIPAIFLVDKDRNESLVNYHVAGDYIIVNRVGNQFTLRNGNYVTSIYNDMAIGDWKSLSK